jgi:hypothetical protein
MPADQNLLAEILLTLAYAGELTEPQAQRLVAPGQPVRVVRALLDTLEWKKLVVQRSVRQAGKSMRLWSLPHQALAQPPLCDHPMRPILLVDRCPGQHLPHHILITEALTQVLTLAGPQGLSGVYVRRQVRPQALSFGGRTIYALLILRWGERSSSVPPPWTREPWRLGMRQLVLTLHGVRGPLNRSLLRRKMTFYRQWYSAWQQRFVFHPLPVWVAETEKHRHALMELWPTIWPTGPCLVTTQESMAADQWWHWDGGYWCEQALFASPVSEVPVPGEIGDRRAA